MQPRTAIIIAGPTAVGKTALAIQLAQYFHTAIISADSRQCYKELTIGTAKPSAADLQAVRHYFINSHSISQEVNAAVFERLSLQFAEEIFRHNNIAVVCGGTGLYVKAFCEGLDEIPEIPVAVRDKVRKEYSDNGLYWLQQQVQQYDPEFYIVAEKYNPQRLMRSLEIILTTGQSIIDFRTGKQKKRDFNIIKIGLSIDKKILHGRINQRVDNMIEAGLVAEVTSLLPYRNYNALNTVGYSEIFDYLDHNVSLEEAIEKIKINTRQYAKRQMTWFRKDTSIHWLQGNSFTDLMNYIEPVLQK